MAQSQGSKADDTTLELPRVTKDPVLSHLREAEDEYVLIKKERFEQAAQLRASRTQLAELRDLVASLEAGLSTSEAENKLRAKELNKASFQLAEARKSLDKSSEELKTMRQQLEQERAASQRYRERSTQLADGLKNIHRALFEGGRLHPDSQGVSGYNRRDARPIYHHARRREYPQHSGCPGCG